jgi:hypothetical protein
MVKKIREEAIAIQIVVIVYASVGKYEILLLKYF